MRRRLIRHGKRIVGRLRSQLEERRPSGSAIRRWMLQGRPTPPPAAIKIRNILVLADLFEISAFVETGTYRGGTVAAVIPRFDRIWSIELDQRLAQRAMQRFASAGEKVRIVQGDSATALPTVIGELPDRVLFWLDGHYSGPGTGKSDRESPVITEIEAIATHRADCRDVIIIDDAREFRGAEGYPHLDEFLEMLRRRFGRHVIVADDAIFMLPVPDTRR